MSKKKGNKKEKKSNQFEDVQTTNLDIRKSLDELFKEADQIRDNYLSKQNIPSNSKNKDDIPSLLNILNITSDIQENARNATNLFNRLKISIES